MLTKEACDTTFIILGHGITNPNLNEAVYSLVGLGFMAYQPLLVI